MVIFDGLKLKLKKALHGVMMEETKKWLIRALLRARLATWDIYNFAINQAGLRTTIRTLDWQTMSAALRAKLRDTTTTLTAFRREKSAAELQIRQEFNECGLTLKQILAPWKKIVKRERKERINRFRQKIKHYRRKQISSHLPQADRGPRETIAPKYLREYKDLSIFKHSGFFPKKRELTGPFIGSSEIILTEDERKVLMKDPKFSVRHELDETEFKVEIEKMNFKRKFEEQEDLKKSEICIKPAVMGDEKEHKNRKEEEKNHSDTEKEVTETLDRIWERERPRLVYDPIFKRIDFRKRRPSDYKHNKRIHLPKAMNSDIEFECEYLSLIHI